MSGCSRPNPAPLWQKRFYDFKVRTEQKQLEKLRYMHRNPVKRGLVDKPELWEWSSFRSYLYGETGLVREISGVADQDQDSSGRDVW